ncbi:MAG TPA: response regulator [Thermoanaerobaculia bacterium]|nr:response regulator [Thermoanaerobaculia bacterium]
MRGQHASRRSAALIPAPPAAQRVLIVEDDPVTLHLLTRLLSVEPALFAPLGVASAEEALEILATTDGTDGTDGIDCLLADFRLPGMDGLELLHSARRIKPDLKVILMTVAPNDELQRQAVASGAFRLLGKPLDLEELLASLESDRPGSLSYLAGDLDLMDVCALFAACQGGRARNSGSGIRVRQEQRSGVLGLRGATVYHASTAGLQGEAAFASLQDWGTWQFESVSLLDPAQRPVNCALEIREGSTPRVGSRAEGNLRGLSLRHLLEWAIRGRLTCVLQVSSRSRTGELRFEAGRIRSAATGGSEGGQAAAEILEWENVQVRLLRTRISEAVAPAPDAPEGGVPALLDRFASEVEGLLATCIFRREDGTAIAGRSLDPRLDPAQAALGYLAVLDSHLAAAGRLGMSAAWGETEDILITTANAYLLLRLLGDGYYHWLAVSDEANLAICRLQMRGYAASLLSALRAAPRLKKS